jgi:hypothetical protein
MAPAGMPMHHGREIDSTVRTERGKASSLRQGIAVAGPDLEHAVGRIEPKKLENDVVLGGGLPRHDARNEVAQQSSGATTLPCNQQRFTHDQPPIVSPCLLGNFFTPDRDDVFAGFRTCAI